MTATQQEDTDADIFRLLEQSPLLLLGEIEGATTIAGLRLLHGKVQGMVAELLEAGINIQTLIRLIARLNDLILLRLMEIVRIEGSIDLHDRFAFVVLGSQGRGEQTLTTDQDTALIYANDLTSAEVQHLSGFCRDVTDGFVAIGIPCCPGGTMASNEFWRRSSGGWQQEIDGWFSDITLDNIINVAMFSDMRTLYGNPALERDLKAHIAGHLGHNELFLMKMAANVHRISIPLGWSGRIKTETGGPHRGELDIKRGGIFTITEGVKVMALEAKLLDGGTVARIAGLVEAAVLSPAEAANLLAAFDELLGLRLRFQVASFREGIPPGNYILPGQLNRMERGRLRLALEEVRFFQGLLKRRYQLGLIP